MYFRRASMFARKSATTTNTGSLTLGPRSLVSTTLFEFLTMDPSDERDFMLDAKSFDDLADWSFTPASANDGLCVIFWQ